MQIAHEIIEPLSPLWFQVNLITIFSIIFLLFCAKNLNLEHLKKFTFLIGVILCSRVVFMQLYQLYMSKWVAASSIPIHLCGLSSILAGILMFRRNQLAYECLFYWGLAGAIQSLLTPEFALGKDDPVIFLDYFISHGGIIFAALYLTVILGMRPRKKSWLSVFLFSQILIPIIGLINWILGSNYMYLSQKPIVDNPLIIGDWPYYILFIEIIALINFWLLYQPIKWIDSFSEEVANTITHGFGFLLSIVGLIGLLCYNNPEDDIWRTIGFSIYGTSLILLYLSSTLYHSATNHKLKKIFKRFDHSAIFLLIAGTYTPIVLIAMRDTWVIYLFILIWVMTVFGIMGEFLFTEKFKSFEFIMYIAMGWMALIAIKPLLALPTGSFDWIIGGGIIYSLGVIFYKWDSLRYNHTMWHLFVLGGSACHFIAMFYI